VTGVLLLYIFGLYALPERSVPEIIYSIILSVFFLTVITMALSYFLRSFSFPRTIIALNAGFQLLFLSLWRAAAYYIGRVLHGRQKILVVGHGSETDAIRQKIMNMPNRLYDIEHTFDLDKQAYKDLRRLIKPSSYVFICPGTTPSERQKIFSYCITADANIFIIPDLIDISVKNARLQTFDDAPVFFVDRLRLTWDQRVIKRSFDIVFSLMVLILTAPFMLIAALAIHINTAGGVIFKQERITKNNHKFEVYKFRTMYMDAEEHTGPVLASENDARLTKVGKFLRRRRLAELPQFLNVLKGEMSVVGPRPERPYFIDQFTLELPDYEYRATVKAGITGYAQVMGKYTTSASDKLRFDLWYIKNYSLWMDITLIMQTIRLMLDGKINELPNRTRTHGNP
jgi:exopolysaccharide biosynthesis polyprenyl glycosylphosphotransferase